jgi:hypothetical protein
MNCYFDKNDSLNLSNIDQIRSVRKYDELLFRISHKKLIPIVTTNYSSPGVYIIEVSKHSHLWCADNFPNSFKILENIPSHVISAAQKKILRIVIISIIEGDSFNSTCDCFDFLHKSFQQLNLPRKGVLIISGNLRAQQQYETWCRNKLLNPLLEFIEGIEWFGEHWKKQYEPIFYNSIKNHSKFFNSLNRAHRTHRTDHLYFLAKNELLNKGMISGGALFKENLFLMDPTFISEDPESFKQVLNNNYPLSIDIPIHKVAESHLAGISNLDIFQNTLLTVSTETFFDDPGLFITEKTFRPIAIGHPFIILGQFGILKKLQSYGFRTDFIDTSYDDIEDNKKRFAKFHESFLNWINDEDKEKYFKKWIDIVEHNLYTYKRLNFRKQYLDKIISTTEEYFKESF